MGAGESKGENDALLRTYALAWLIGSPSHSHTQFCEQLGANAVMQRLLGWVSIQTMLSLQKLAMQSLTQNRKKPMPGALDKGRRCSP